MILNINGKKIQMAERSTEGKTADAIRSFGYRWDDPDPEYRKNFRRRVLLGSGIVLIAGLTAGAIVTRELNSIQINNALDNGAADDIGATKDVLADKGIKNIKNLKFRVDKLNDTAKKNVIYSLINGTKIQESSKTLAGILKENNISRTEFNKFIDSPSFKKSDIGSHLIKTAKKLVSNKRDSEGISADDTDNLISLFNTWKSMNR